MTDEEQPRRAAAEHTSETTPLLNGTTTNGTIPGSAAANDDETTVVAETVSGARLALILGTSYFGVFLGAIDSTIIATLSGPISSEFKSLSLLSWLATAYLISNAACQPISGRLTDIFGRGPGLVFSNLFFAAGNLICGLATSQSAIIFGRVVAGVGGGGLMGVYQGIGNIAYGSGAMLGGVFGGLINDHTAMGWRLAFLVQVPPVLLSAVLVAVLVKVPPKASDKSYLARIDFFGVFLTISFLVLLLLGLNAGGNLVPWSHPLPLTTIPLSIVAFVAFLVWETKVKQPIIPVRLLYNRTILAACLTNLLCTMVMMMAMFYVPLYLQVNGLSATQAGLRILTSPAGYIMKRTGKYVVPGICALILFNTGIIILTQFNEETPAWVNYVVFFLVGGGYGAMLTITLLGCIAAVDHSQQAVITSATYLARSLGGTIGITIGSAVYQNVLRNRLWDRFGDYPDAAEIIRRIRDDLDELKNLPPGWKPGVVDSFMEAFGSVWYTMLGLSILALVFISLMRQHVLHSTLERR
ncbi:major facilitator superfamily transporter [Colletotrichum higginsianum]|nr:major facilitator superfamily transporter [Colletotrichum higginsianum]